MERRPFLLQSGAALAGILLPSLARARAEGTTLRIAGGWQMNEREYQVGALRVDWTQGPAKTEFAVTVPSLPHAIVPEPGGGFLAVATRPGAWMVRIDARGELVRRLDMSEEGDARTFDGHVIASHDGRWLYTGETDRTTGDGWVSVRDARDLRKAAEHRTHGIDPHQVLVDAQGMLVIANGGIPRTPTGRKRDLDRMSPTLVRLDPHAGEMLGTWSLPDRRLSPHHIAWNRPAGDGAPTLLGIGLQAEHDDPARRREAPLLAVWDGQALAIPTHEMAEGYAGDVAPGPDGGFVLTAQFADRILLWRPERPSEFATIGKVRNPCGLWPLRDAPGVTVGAGVGIARWHPSEPASMLRWPAGLSAGNHWAVLG